MSVIQVQARVSTEQLLEAVEQMPTDEFSAFVSQLLVIRVQREIPRLPATEARLLMQINQSIAPELQRRYDDLCIRRQAAILTSEEYTELLTLSDQIEQWAADRIAFLAELARIRQVSLPDLMSTLGIQAPEYV